MPIIWHIMQHYIHYGFDEFVICAGYKSDLLKNFFLKMDSVTSDFTIDFRDEEPEAKYHSLDQRIKAKVTVCYTGQNTMTGGRLSRVREHLQDDEHFLLTYGDGVSNVPIDQLINFHRDHGKLATLTAVYPPPKFGNLKFDGDAVTAFTEKSGREGSLVNGGFYVFKREFLDLLENDSECILEKAPLEKAASTKQLMAFKHLGFWQCMDTSRDLEILNDLWASGDSPWAAWPKHEYID